MKLKILTLAVLIVIVSCKEEKNTSTMAKNEVISNRIINKELSNINISKGEPNTIDLEVYDYAGFEKFLNKKDNKTYVINFWATWCAPCVKELPFFEKLNSEYVNDDVEVILVSLDFPHMYEKKLKPFIIDNNLKSKVIALDDVDMNSWIPKVNKNWSGSIPATIIYKNDNRKFFEQSFTYKELETELKPFLN